jgi:teichuronic acid biosynthesis glycosyltransferase TuaC
LRVLSFTSLYPNNVNPLHGIFIHQRVIHLMRRPGISVEVIAPIPYSPSWLPIAKWKSFSQVRHEEEIDSVRVHHPRYPIVSGISMPLHGLLVFLGAIRLARQLHRKVQFDCIDAHFIYPDGFAAVLVGKVLKLPVIVSARGTDINVYPSYRMIRPMLRWTLRNAAAVIAVSGDLKNKMLELGVPETKIQVISNGVDVERFQPQEQRAARQRLGIPEEGAVLLSVGSLIESKGHHLVIAAMAELGSKWPELRLYIVGEGVYRPQLEDLIREKQLQGRIFLRGNRSNAELATWFSAASLSCLMSSREGWPNVVSESLACGTPVLATRVGGIPEILISPELGQMVSRDVPSIADGLDSALARSWNRQEIANYGRSRSWDAVSGEVAALLEAKTGQVKAK